MAKFRYFQIFLKLFFASYEQKIVNNFDGKNLVDSIICYTFVVLI